MDKDLDDKFEDVISSMKTQRDELRVQLHLMKADMKDEWHELEEKWDRLEPKLNESAEDIGAASKQLAGEIASAYQRIKAALK